ncbi:MAG: aldo/keto reductase [Polyangiaceae bacterium]|nr:aldo/keto reductase [Polyangiaceae bacterium]
MKYQRIPGTDLVPSSIALGCATLGKDPEPHVTFQLFDTYVEHGGTFLDTAKVYSDWLPGEKSQSEKTIGAWVRERRNRASLTIATKGCHPELSTMHVPRLSPAELRADINASLSHLDTDYIDLYWLHRDDPTRPVAEILDALNAEVQAGKIRYFACSNWSVARIAEAAAYRDVQKCMGFCANQVRFSLAHVEASRLSDPTSLAMDEAMFAYHEQTGLACAAYGSQAGGWFHKAKELARVPGSLDRMFESEVNRERMRRAQHVAEATSRSLTQIVLGYLMAQPFPTFPIVGCRTKAQLLDSLEARNVELSLSMVQYLDGRREYP